MRSRAITLRALAPLLAGAIPIGLRALSGAPSGSRAAVGRRLVGCYELTVGPWSGGRTLASLPAAQRPPTQIMLDTTRVASMSGDGDVARYVVRPAALDPQALTARVPTPAFWAVLGVDSVTILWSTGFVGVEVRARASGDGLEGVAHTFHDGLMPGEPPDPTAPVIARRMSCPPEIRAPAG